MEHLAHLFFLTLDLDDLDDSRERCERFDLRRPNFGVLFSDIVSLRV